MKIVSIGSACFIASEMKLLGHKTESYPFDWIESNLQLVIDSVKGDPFDDVMERWIKNEFKDYPENGGFKNLRFAHHTPADYEYFKRCWQRWKELLGSTEPVLFLHADVNGHFKDYSYLHHLKDELLKTNLNFKIVSLHPVIKTPETEYTVDYQDDHLMIIKPEITIPLMYHWLWERHLWDPIWKRLFEELK